jgi:NarL family two-component system sensor histidine kinase LiaS
MRLRQRLPFVFPSRWRTLRARLAVSYVAVTFGSVLTFVVLAALARGALISLSPGSSTPTDFTTQIGRQAETYAMLAALQSTDTALDPRTTFIPGQTHTIALADQSNLDSEVAAPYVATTRSADPTSVAIALLISPGGGVVSASYPSLYPAGIPVSRLTSVQRQAIDQALLGQPSRGKEQISSVTLRYAAVPVWSQDHQVAPDRPAIGAIFLQVPEPMPDSFIVSLWHSLYDSLVFLVLATPVGVFFGWITARGLVRRVHQLVLATTHFASGDYTERIAVTHEDEIGQLERQFNEMAEQMRENISRRQRLAEENARLEERSRISRELHDAVSQDLFSLRLLADGLQEAASAGSSSADLRPHISMLEQTTGSMSREMRALLLELRPTELENLGLVGALRKLADIYSARLGITVTTDLRPVPVSVKTEHALLRIAQESLANAARHAGASLVSLTLTGRGSTALLTVTDNGKGFVAPAGADIQPNADGNDGNGLGLRIMRERAEELAGTFELSSGPGQGTRIAVAVPVENADD